MRSLEVSAALKIPRATYRLQLNAGFTFRDAASIVPYLAALGISHVYCSPYFRARSGSMHGYDVVDHNSFNPEIGTREDFEHFVATLRAHEMGHILDIVPNHVGIMGSDNEWWSDVLENGEASVNAEYFDIDWMPANPVLAHKVLVPVLGDPYGIVLERGEIQLQFEPQRGAFAVFYHEHRFPLDPRTYPRILDRALAHVSNEELENLRRAFGELPDGLEPTRAQIDERHRNKELDKQRLAALCEGDESVAAAVEAAVRSLSGEPGHPASFDALHELLESQAYRLAYWRVAADDINYRRFFDVNDLAALRVENEAVFEATHKLVLELVKEGKIDGLRIDHPDGLFDPAQYFNRLQSHIAGGAAVSFGVAGETRDLPIYLVVEKITASFEALPVTWPVHGETGYHFANVVNRMLVDAATKVRMDRVYRAFVDQSLEWTQVAYEAQHLILRRSLASELNVVANRLARIAQTDRRTRDFTLNSLRQALAEVIACFPVYRTYVSETVSAQDRKDIASVSTQDRKYIDWAIAAARTRRSATEAPLFDFVRSALLMEVETASENLARRIRLFTMKFQQVTAPVTAKGIEDTALYRFNRLVSLNEVGGEPEAYGSSVRAFHADAQHRARCWPHEMLATSTHDTKRSGDVRARINVLSEMVAVWRQTLERWSRINRSRQRDVEGRQAPSRNDEYLLYQTLIGSWPLDLIANGAAESAAVHGDPDSPRTGSSPARELAITAYRERIESYMVKAVREAKVRTSWANPNEPYEEALRQFIRSILDPRDGNLFVSDFIGFQKRVTRFGLYNGLTQTLCKLTAPGVPDLYQGDELWDFSLVDPDNRRPVDYGTRVRMLAEIQREFEDARDDGTRVRALVDNLGDGRGKLYLIWKTLQFRQRHPELFRDAEYLPLKVTGEHASKVCAFARRFNEELAIVIAPRLYRRLLGDAEAPPLGSEVWGNTAVELPRAAPGSGRGLGSDRRLGNVLDHSQAPLSAGSGGTLPVGNILTHFPLALLSTVISSTRQSGTR